MKITAAVVQGVNQPYEIEEVELTPLQNDEVRVRIVASGICHSDDALRLGHAASPFPIILGHEGAGIVDELGANITTVQKGDHVVLAYAYCNHCKNCEDGFPASCQEWSKFNLGNKHPDGTPFFKLKNGQAVNNMFQQSSFATYANVRETNITKVDKNLDLRLLGPLGCGFLTGSGTVLKGLQVEKGSTIAVFGTGAVGLAAIMAAKIAGCRMIVAVDIHDSRLEIAKELGATHVINSKHEDPVVRVKELTDQKGVQYSVDTSGVSSVMKTSIDVLAIRGVAAPIAVTKNQLEMNSFVDMVLPNRRIYGVLMGDSVPQLNIPKLIEYHQAGLFPYDKLIKNYDFKDINQASADSLSGKTIKPVLIIDQTYQGPSV